MVSSRGVQAIALTRVRQYLETDLGKNLLRQHGLRRTFSPTQRFDERQNDISSVVLHRKGVLGVGKKAAVLSMKDNGTRLIVAHDGKSVASMRRLGRHLQDALHIENLERKRLSE